MNIVPKQATLYTRLRANTYKAGHFFSFGFTNIWSYLFHSRSHMGFVRGQLQTLPAMDLYKKIGMHKIFSQNKRLLRKIKRYNAKRLNRLAKKYQRSPTLHKSILLNEAYNLDLLLKKFYENVTKIIIGWQGLEHEELSEIVGDEEDFINLISQIPNKMTGTVSVETIEKFFGELNLQEGQVERYVEKVKEQLIKQIRKEKQKELVEQSVTQRLYANAGGKRFGSKLFRWFPHHVGLGRASFHIKRGLKKLGDYKTKTILKDLSELKSDLENNKITDATFSQLATMARHYGRLTTYLDKIKKDQGTVIYAVLNEIESVLDDNTIPFYAGLKGLAENNEKSNNAINSIIVLIKNLKSAQKKITDALEKEVLDEEEVEKAIERLKAQVQAIIPAIRVKNNELMTSIKKDIQSAITSTAST